MKKWIRWGLALLLVLTLLVIFLPTLLARQSVRKWIVDELLAKEGIEADIEHVQLGWFSPTQVNGVSLGPVDRPRLLSVDRILSDRTFWSGITEGIEVGDLTLEHPRITLWIEGGQSNLDFRTNGQPAAPDPLSVPPTRNPAKLNLTVKDAELRIKTDTMPNEVQVFGNLNLNGTLSKDADGRLLVIDAKRILDHAAISPELCRGGLKYMLPVLAEATWTKGDFSIEIASCVIDLDEPAKSLISGTLYIHGIEAGINNALMAAAGERLATLLGRDGLDTVQLAENSVVQFQVRDGLVWHEGVEFGLPKVSPDLVVRTSGSVSFDEELDLHIDVPMPLHLIAAGPIAEALTDKSLVLHATGKLSDPQVKIDDDDFLANLLSNIGSRLAEEEQPLRSVIQGIRKSLRGAGDPGNSEPATDDPATGETATGNGQTPILDRIRERSKNRNGPLQRLFGGSQD